MKASLFANLSSLNVVCGVSGTVIRNCFILTRRDNSNAHIVWLSNGLAHNMVEMEMCTPAFSVNHILLSLQIRLNTYPTGSYEAALRIY